MLVNRKIRETDNNDTLTADYKDDYVYNYY